MTPVEYGDLFTGVGNVAKVSCSAVKPPHLLVPKEIAKSPKQVAGYAAVLEACIKNGYEPKEFLERCRDEGLDIDAQDVHLDLYKVLVRLDKENKNGIWARIIKNNFAPLFVGKVDYVAGNPPWVNWESLPGDYRESTLAVWDHYNLRPEKGQLGKMRGGKKDLSMLFVYVGMDNYLSWRGRLGFVITQTVFKTVGAGDGFRQFRFAAGAQTVVLKPLAVQDLSSMQVFEGATNRTAVLVCEKVKVNDFYPVPYFVWQGITTVNQDLQLQEVLALTHRRKLDAVPIEASRMTSPWLTAPAKAIGGIRKVTGKGDYKAREGVNTGGLNGCYWLNILKNLPSGDLVVENLGDVGKIKLTSVQSTVEPDLVYPLLRGRDVGRWRAEPSCFIIAPQDCTRQREGISEHEMKRKFPKSLAFLRKFEQELAGRRDRKYYPSGSPFYTMRNMAAYSKAEWKVVWPEVGHTVRAGVCGPRKMNSLKPTLPDHTIVAVACVSRSEAHYICALLNSSPAQCSAASYIVLHPSPHIMEHIRIPSFEEKAETHRLLADLSERCHTASAGNDSQALVELEGETDKAAARLWGITKEELNAIQEALLDKRGIGNSDKEEGDVDE